ncbi:2-oxoglutarate dehydrogenase E2 component (dihydrolipoamide succinyltransferase) [Altererythrobacter atlanticus]|uniref:Dihydrolipoyllysine-residue succinyltransferase component of 2-oxoglutarate dehydrogenase complex n=1 Tax=Croceibacterium atlanticum TaxID=1267766 RepID=A0A0F7KNN6_9SPHN|nr:2-oxoglutarate dehydrogenase complex dihydrolipoyllysine-residue succinyltransferase [Croceibacterium atlanticum]AKH41179.1 Dihydrolipoyllysine-residue succinyltransferase component of 2-oxoglutarate dehydrogenase complex [Croceibacterium atlanticum]MBB5732695.1 2-oxoglutarate dehydrogenase E2 component (dihydrolipoamide succinyltransferase) [Croceibacterium atlanticum]
MASEVKVPTLGESVTEATIGEWLKKPGDAVALDEPIASLETDKVAVEVPAPIAGIMGAYKAEVGETVEVGAVIAVIEEGQAQSGPEDTHLRKDEAEKASSAEEEIEALPSGEEGGDASTTLSPAVRRAVLEHGVDPTTIKGTGKDGRLTKEDVIAAAKAKQSSPAPSASAPAPSPTPATAEGERVEERVKMTRLRQTIAKRLKGAQEEAALLTTFNDVDMTAVMEARAAYKDVFAKKHNIKLGFMSFFAKAACLALKDVPAVNARIDGDEIVYHKYVDLSVAVSAPNGLVVPVVRNVERMSFAEVEQAIADYGQKAKDGALTMQDMAGGTFTISNGGVFGSLMSTPIINPPQSAVLGLHRIEERPVAVNGEVVIRPMMYIALSYDHRIIDGREAVTALKIIKEAIEDPMRMLIDL